VSNVFWQLIAVETVEIGWK